MKLLTLFFVLTTWINVGNSKPILLDKILAVIDSQTITLSKISRIKTNLKARKDIAPQLYPKNSLGTSEIVQILINSKMIKDHLKNMGIMIGDEQTEDLISQNEKRLGINRTQLLSILKNYKLTFEEYFQLSRSLHEMNNFYSIVIVPLISVTEQEIKNTFFKNNLGNKTLTLKYTLLDFRINKNHISKKDSTKFPKELKKYRINGIISEKFKNFETETIEELYANSLTKKLSNLLKNTDEGSFSKTILLNDGLYHAFYLKEKNLVESDLYLKQKERIREMLFQKKAKELITVWLEREKNKHFIKYFL